jgi:hypothetical protein
MLVIAAFPVAAINAYFSNRAGYKWQTTFFITWFLTIGISFVIFQKIKSL